RRAERAGQVLALERLGIERVEGVERHHFAALGEQPLHEGGSDEARSARHQDPLRPLHPPFRPERCSDAGRGDGSPISKKPRLRSRRIVSTTTSARNTSAAQPPRLVKETAMTQKQAV